MKDWFYDRLHRKIIPEPNSGCWLWMGAYNRKSGYGFVRDRNMKMTNAHRLVYCEEIGPIPYGLDLDHLCRNPACVNPDHLEPVTRSENVKRGYSPELSRERWEGNQHWKLRLK
jgi:hypothetical protein